MKQFSMILAIVGSITFTAFGSDLQRRQQEEQRRQQDAARAAQQAQWSNQKVDWYTMSNLKYPQQSQAQQYNQNISGQRK